MKIITQEQIDQLNSAYPVMETGSRPSFPRFGMISKDIVETTGSGKNKKITVVQSAGTFYTEKDNGEVDEEGKKVWTKEFLGEEVDVIIAFHRKQLRLYDKGLEKYFSTPIYDNKEQIIPLYLDKKIVARGNQKTLQDLYPAMSESGKKTSKLKEETILFVVYNNELYQCTLTQSSKWSFKDYSKNVKVPSVVTTLGSVEETNGSNTYRKMTFKNKRIINSDEFELVKGFQDALGEQVQSDAQYFLSKANERLESGKKDEDLDDIVNEAKNIKM